MCYYGRIEWKSRRLEATSARTAGILKISGRLSIDSLRTRAADWVLLSGWAWAS